MGLTVRQVESAKPKDRPYKLTDGDGLYLYVSAAGGKSWRANYTEAKKQKTRTYGRWPELGLAEARKEHAKARGGGGQEAPPAPTAPTFKEVARRWLLRTLPSLTNPKHRIQVENTLEQYAYPKLGARPINEIKRPELVKVVEAVQDDGGKIETAHRVAGRITAVFDYALDVGILEGHPAAKLSRVLIPREVKKPMPSIPPEEAGALLCAIDSYPEPVTRLGLLLVAYTFPRVNEVLGFRRDELREGGAVWVVPAERVKGEGESKLPHVIPMAPQARAIVKQLTEMSGCDLVLESAERPGHQLSENTLLFALYRLGYKGRMTVHGFRALASTVLNEQSGFPHDVIERQLAHKETDQVRAAYNRAQYLDQRRELMVWWANWLDAQREAHPRSSAHPSPAAGRSSP